MNSHNDNHIIAIVDDDDSVRRAMRRLIQSTGLHAESFASPAELLASGLQRFRCLLLDVELPGMNGFELYRHVLVDYPQMPAVFITARPSVAARRQATEAGAVALLGKPFDERALFDAILCALSDSSEPEPVATPG